MIEQQVGHQCLEGRSVVRNFWRLDTLCGGNRLPVHIWESVTRSFPGIGHPLGTDGCQKFSHPYPFLYSLFWGSVTRENILGIGHPWELVTRGNRSPVRYKWVSKVFPSIPLFVFSVFGDRSPARIFWELVTREKWEAEPQFTCRFREDFRLVKSSCDGTLSEN